jgi:hypothetical protein
MLASNAIAAIPLAPSNSGTQVPAKAWFIIMRLIKTAVAPTFNFVGMTFSYPGICERPLPMHAFALRRTSEHHGSHAGRHHQLIANERLIHASFQ